MGEIVLEASLFGPRWGQRGFAANFVNGVDMRLQAAYLETATAIMTAYKDDIAKRFALYHGQSGETEQSMEVTVPEAAPDVFKIGVRIGGHVGFVVNPLPTHFEPNIPHMLGDATPTGAASGRATNMFSPFGPRWDVTWYQGGEESFSPDTSWYTGDDAFLVAEAHTQLAKLSLFVALSFGIEGQDTLYTRRTIAIIQGPYYRGIANTP